RPRSRSGTTRLKKARSTPIEHGSPIMSDHDDILAIETRYNDAWNRHDPDGMVESLTDDGQFVTVNGVWMKTRTDFLHLMQRLHGAGGPFTTSSRETLELDVRMLSPDSAMVHSRFRVAGDVEEDGRTVA